MDGLLEMNGGLAVVFVFIGIYRKKYRSETTEFTGHR
jgi:hypothetical protein